VTLERPGWLVDGMTPIAGMRYCTTHDDFADERNNGDACRAFEHDHVAGTCTLVDLFIKQPELPPGLPVVAAVDVPPGVAVVVQDGRVTRTLRLVD